MKKVNKHVISRICVLVGVAMLTLGILILICWQGYIHFWVQKSEHYVEKLQNLTPEPQGTVPQERRDNTMPVLSVDEIDFIGILEMPRYGVTLPVCADWGGIIQCPCKFSGSIYDSTLQIGATSQRGQFDFCREISVGDAVLFTDVEGNRYTYTVTNLQYEKHADQTALNRKEANLTLFIKNVYDFEYLIISCDVLN